MAGSGSEPLHRAIFTSPQRLIEDSKARLMRDCMRKRNELMENARSQALASADCRFEWTLSGAARNIAGANELMSTGIKPGQVTHWDTLDLITLIRAMDKGQVRVRAWDEYSRKSVDQPRQTHQEQTHQEHMHQEQIDLFARCMRLVDAKIGMALSWDAYGPETAVLISSFSKPFQLKLGDWCLHWQFTIDYPSFPSREGGFKEWSSQQALECDIALTSGYLSLVSCSSEVQPALSTEPVGSIPPVFVPKDLEQAEGTKIPGNNDTGSSHSTSRHPTPIFPQRISEQPQPDLDFPDSYPISGEILDQPKADPANEFTAALNKQSEEISTLQTQLKRVQNQAISHLSKIQTLQLELDVAKSGLRQSESDIVVLRTEIQDMKDFIYKQLEPDVAKSSLKQRESDAIVLRKIQDMKDFINNQSELGITNSALKQSENDVDVLRAEIQDMKDFINKRSTVTCNLEFLTEKLEQRIEQLESQACCSSQGPKPHTPEPTESLPETVSMVPDEVPVIKSEYMINEINNVDTSFDLRSPEIDPNPIQYIETVRNTSADATATSRERDPSEAEVQSELDVALSTTASDLVQDPQDSTEGSFRSNNPVSLPSREACLKELGLSLTRRERKDPETHKNQICLISKIYKNWGAFPSEVLPQKMLPENLGGHQQVLKILTNLSSTVPPKEAIRLLQQSLDNLNKSFPNLPARSVITKRALTDALAQASNNDTRPHQVQDGGTPTSSGNNTYRAGQLTPTSSKAQDLPATKKRYRSEDGSVSNPQKRLRPHLFANVDDGPRSSRTGS